MNLYKLRLYRVASRKQPEFYSYVHDSNSFVDPFGLSENPYSYFDEAILKQGENIKIGDNYPSSFPQAWEEDGYKYIFRAHSADPNYGKNGRIFRVSKQEVRKGTSYSDKNGNWHNESTLRPGKNGNVNPNRNR